MPASRRLLPGLATSVPGHTDDRRLRRQPHAAEAAACDRACLSKLGDAYYAALKANDAKLLPQAAGARITDNGTEKKLADTFWASAEDVTWRFDIVNTRRGDFATQVVIRNADGTQTMQVLRLKVQAGAITEIETVKANKGDADRLWGPEQLDKVPSDDLQRSIRPVDRDSYYDLIAATESYWRAFQTNGTPNYRRARILPSARRFENGFQTTGLVRDGVYQDTVARIRRGPLPRPQSLGSPLRRRRRGARHRAQHGALRPEGRRQEPERRDVERSPGRGVLRDPVRPDQGSAGRAVQPARREVDRLADAR